MERTQARSLPPHGRDHRTPLHRRAERYQLFNTRQRCGVTFPKHSLLLLVAVATAGCAPRQASTPRPSATCTLAFRECMAFVERGMSQRQFETLLGEADHVGQEDTNGIVTWIYVRDGSRYEFYFRGLSLYGWCSTFLAGRC